MRKRDAGLEFNPVDPHDQITHSGNGIPLDLEIKIQRTNAERKAWDSLSRYKFYMFGYWAATWVKYNQLLPADRRKPSPFAGLVKEAKIEAQS